MQMAKTSAALARLAEAGVPYISLVDRSHHRRRYRQLCLAWRHHSGRAGSARSGLLDRVWSSSSCISACPKIPTRPNSQLAHGMIDAVVHRRMLRPTLAKILRLYHSASGVVSSVRVEFTKRSAEVDSQSTLARAASSRREKRYSLMAFDLEFERPLADLDKRVQALQRKADRLKPDERAQLA